VQTTLPDLIRCRQRFLLTGHENPDGDCIGSQVALFHLLRDLGKQVAIVNPDPIGRGYDFLLRHTPFGDARNGQSLPDFEVAVLLDCCQLERTGPLAARIRERDAVLAVIDHHVGSDAGDGAVLWVDPAAAATGALVHRLYRALGLPLSAAAAEGVFLSLVADTGWFRYSNTDAGVLAMAAELAAGGVDVSALYDRLYRRMHPDSAAIMGEALRLHELRLGGRLALVRLDRTFMDRAARADFDTDLVIDPLRSLEGVEVVALLKERFDGQVKLSLRAKRDVDVQKIAAAFGGGGHRKAAGATVKLELGAAAAAVEERVRLALASAPRERA
jgi:phosphoesterase RecJ-like protein